MKKNNPKSSQISPISQAEQDRKSQAGEESHHSDVPIPEHPSQAILGTMRWPRPALAAQGLCFADEVIATSQGQQVLCPRPILRKPRKTLPKTQGKPCFVVSLPDKLSCWKGNAFWEAGIKEKDTNHPQNNPSRCWRCQVFLPFPQKPTYPI